jgi:glycosyltransferase involved in cell wall biosynthesis
LLIVHVINDLQPSGAENFLLRLCQRLTNHTHHVISLGEAGRMAAGFGEIGVTVETVDMRSVASLPATILRLTRRLNALRPDIVQTWLYRTDLLGGIAARLAGVPAVVWSIRHGNLAPETNRWHTLATAKVCALLSWRIPDVVLANSVHARDIHIRIGYRPRPFEVIPNGFDLTQFRPSTDARQRVRATFGLADDAFVFGMLGRYVHQKGFAVFIEAAGKLARIRSRVRFILAGRDVVAENSELREMIDRCGLAGKVLLLGERSDVAELLNAFDALVFPSIEGEGFPNVLGEAMATGLPCITSDVSECAEIVGNSGLVVPARDAAALAAAMERFIGMDRQEREAMAVLARQRVLENFEMGEIVARYAAFYDRVAGSTWSPYAREGRSATATANTATLATDANKRTIGR